MYFVNVAFKAQHLVGQETKFIATINDIKRALIKIDMCTVLGLLY